MQMLMTPPKTKTFKKRLREAAALSECDSCNKITKLCSGCGRCLPCCQHWKDQGESQCEEENGMWIDTNDCQEHFHCFHRNEDGKLVVCHVDESECEDAEFSLAEPEAA